MAKGGFTHNVSFTIGSAEYGFQLADDGKGKKAYNRANLNLLPDAAPTTGASNSDTNPEKRIIKEQKSFKGGISQNWFDSADMYQYANGVDAVIDGYLALAPKRLDEYQPALTALNTWVVTGTTPTYTGTTLAAWSSSSGTLSFNAATLTAANSGQPFCVLADVGLNGGTIILTVTAGTVSTATTFTSNVARTLSSGCILPSAGTVTIDAFVNAASGTISNIRYGTSGPFCQFGGTLYMGRDNALIAIPPSGMTFSHCTSFDANITDISSLGANMYVAAGSAKTLKYHNIPTDEYVFWSAATVNAQYLSVSAGNLTASSANAVQSYNGSAWGAAVTVGETGSTITCLPNHTDSLFVCKTNGVYEVNGTTVTGYLDLSSENNSATGKNTLYWHNTLFIPSGDYGLWSVDDNGLATNITPALSTPGLTSYRKQVQAMAGDGTWLDVFIEDGTITRYLRGYNTSDGWIWHDLGAGPTVSQFYDANIYVWNGAPFTFLATSGGLSYYYHKKAYDTPIETGYQMVSGGTIYAARHDLGFRNANKAFYSITVDGEPQANSTITAYYTTNDTTWTAAGTITGGTAAVFPSTFYFATGTTATYLRPRFDFVSAAATITPYFSSYSITGQLLEDKKNIWDVGLMLTADSLHRNSGANERINVETAVSAINTGVNSDWPVTFVDIDGSTHYVVMRLTADQILSDDANGQTKRYIGLNLQEVDWQ